ncbi:MAG: hypothetical protein LW825_02005, partial [Candidatus Jidaibacter sp.]|nr:hypothetical protein [Candidatus Jidaibacter sp.]
TMSRWSATFTAKILEVFALNYKVLIEAFIHVRVVTPLLLNFNAVALANIFFFIKFMLLSVCNCVIIFDVTFNKFNFMQRRANISVCLLRAYLLGVFFFAFFAHHPMRWSY